LTEQMMRCYVVAMDAPLEQVTTSSLEAPKALSLGEQRRGGFQPLALPFFQHAIELDPDAAVSTRDPVAHPRQKSIPRDRRSGNGEGQAPRTGGTRREPAVSGSSRPA
jgi:hypothetical protein